MYVENENMIDMATALSATGPTYIFMMMEALVDAGVHMGFSRHVAQDLVHQTMLGAVLFARESHKHPAELRNMVTSPGGTSEEAIYQMEKGSLRTVLSKAVWAAYQRADSLGKSFKSAAKTTATASGYNWCSCSRILADKVSTVSPSITGTARCKIIGPPSSDSS